MSDITEKTVTTDEEVITPATETTEPVTKTDTGNEDEKGYVALRVERAEKRTQKNILNELGVDDLATAKAKLTEGQTALERITALEKQLADKEARITQKAKEDSLVKLLENHKVFDAEALMLYVDLDTVKLDETGNLQEGDAIIELLKTRKPNYFGTFSKESDAHVQGSVATINTAVERQRAGDTIGAIAQDINAQLKLKR